MTLATADHNIPTMDQDQPIKDDLCRNQVETLAGIVENSG
jgi:3-isopropylmalate/(R)-2-methylmalate dehydratase large subunit